MKIFISCCLFIALTACASYKNQKNILSKVIENNSIIFNNTNKKDVQKALIQVFLLAKDDTFTTITANEDSVAVQIQQNPYWILGFSRIVTKFNFHFTENKNDVLMTVEQQTNSYINMFAFLSDYHGILETNSALNDLIIKRMNYLLGKSNVWYTCTDYKKLMNQQNINENIDALCWFASDISPQTSDGKKIIQNIKI